MSDNFDEDFFEVNNISFKELFRLYNLSVHTTYNQAEVLKEHASSFNRLSKSIEKCSTASSEIMSAIASIISATASTTTETTAATTTTLTTSTAIAAAAAAITAVTTAAATTAAATEATTATATAATTAATTEATTAAATAATTTITTPPPQPPPSQYFTSRNVSLSANDNWLIPTGLYTSPCFLCSYFGHGANNCPNLIDDYLMNCFKCWNPGHSVGECNLFKAKTPFKEGYILPGELLQKIIKKE
jgi:ABC-type transporter Mla subunit MlaD